MKNLKSGNNLSEILSIAEKDIRQQRTSLGVREAWELVLAAIKFKVPYITTLAATIAAARGIAACRKGHGRVKSLQRYHEDIG